MRNTILIAVISLLIAGCSKDKVTTRPSLKYKSANGNVVNQGNILQMKLSFTDAEGDVDSIFIKKITPYCNRTTFVEDRKLPSEILKEGEILVSYGYRVENFPAIGDPQCNFNDTCTFRFVIKDKKGNKSDTVFSEPIVIIKL